MPVLIDPTGAFLSAIGASSPNSNTVVVGPGVEVVFKQKYGWTGALSAVDALITP